MNSETISVHDVYNYVNTLNDVKILFHHKVVQQQLILRI